MEIYYNRNFNLDNFLNFKKMSKTFKNRIFNKETRKKGANFILKRKQD